MNLRACCVALVGAVALLLPAPAHARGPRPGTSGYTVSRIADGLQLTVHFDRRAYPARALIPVTATLRNLSRQHLAVPSERLPYGLCSWPVISIVAINARGEDAEPPQSEPIPRPPCPAPLPRTLAIGQTVVEHQFIVLWTGRLQITAQMFNVGNNSYLGFQFPQVTARFSLHTAQAPTISVQNRAGATAAVISPPPGAGGRFYYRSWSVCTLPQLGGAIYYRYWTARQDRVVPASCAHPTRWHIDVAWLNGPVASLNLGVNRSPWGPGEGSYAGPDNRA